MSHSTEKISTVLHVLDLNLFSFRSDLAHLMKATIFYKSCLSLDLQICFRPAHFISAQEDATSVSGSKLSTSCLKLDELTRGSTGCV